MKKLLFTGLLALGLITTGCYKDNYDQAVITIEQLEKKIENLEVNLQTTIMQSESRALALAELERTIVELDNVIINLEGANAGLVEKALDLESQITTLNERILAAIEERDNHVQQLAGAFGEDKAQLEAQIESLTQEIVVLENQEPEIIIEYITIIETIYRDRDVVNPVNTDLQAEVRDLKLQLNAISLAAGEDVPYPDLVNTEFSTVEVELLEGSSFGDDGDGTYSNGHVLIYKDRNGRYQVDSEDDSFDREVFDGFTEALAYANEEVQNELDRQEAARVSQERRDNVASDVAGLVLQDGFVLSQSGGDGLQIDGPFDAAFGHDFQTFIDVTYPGGDADTDPRYTYSYRGSDGTIRSQTTDSLQDAYDQSLTVYTAPTQSDLDEPSNLRFVDVIDFTTFRPTGDVVLSFSMSTLELASYVITQPDGSTVERMGSGTRNYSAPVSGDSGTYTLVVTYNDGSTDTVMINN